jgi:hypothetical protein
MGLLPRGNVSDTTGIGDLSLRFQSNLLRQILESTPAPLPHPENLLSQLIPLTNLPRAQEDLNAFFITSFASTPSSSAPLSKKAKLGALEGKSASGRKNRKGKGKGKESGVDALPDWMAYYESSEDEEDVKIGKKRSASGRSAQLSVHASIHSVVSHQNMYTGLWEAVLGGVPLDEGWTRKILVGLHGSKGILGHMKPERRVRVADWLGSLVDRGGADAMLAMNGLFVLMTQYNLYVESASSLSVLLASPLLSSPRFSSPLRVILHSVCYGSVPSSADVPQRLPQLLPTPLRPPRRQRPPRPVSRPFLPSDRHFPSLGAPPRLARRFVHQATVPTGAHGPARGGHHGDSVCVQPVQEASGLYGHAPATRRWRWGVQR